MLGAGDSEIIGLDSTHIGRGWSTAFINSVFSFLNSFILSIPALGGTGAWPEGIWEGGQTEKISVFSEFVCPYYISLSDSDRSTQ